MIVLEVLLLAAVLFGVAAVAAGRGDALADAPRDGADLGLPGDRPLLAADLENVRFPMAVRGYRMAAVDDTLDRLALELAERDERIATLESRIPPATITSPQVDDPGDQEQEWRRPGGSYRLR